MHGNRDTTDISGRSAAAEQARRVAQEAARRGGVDVRRLDTLTGQREAVALVGRVWGADGAAVLPPHLARAAEHAGNYLAGASAGGRLVGMCLGLLGLDEGRLVLHSHILGVAPEARGAGVGRALKLDQRAWAAERGIGEITWTYDPLVVRNGYFNLTKLGAEIVAYHVDFYGPMDDGVNAGDDSDRVTVAWRLGAPRVVAAVEGSPGGVPAAEARVGDAAVALDVGDDGGPVEHGAREAALRCRVPTGIEALRRDDPPLARRWRRALRDVMGGALADGYTVTAATREGWYLLERAGEGGGSASEAPGAVHR